MCTMQSSRTSAVGQLCFHDQTEKGVCLLIPRGGARGKKSLKDIIFVGCQRCGRAGDYILLVKEALLLLSFLQSIL